MKTKKESPGIQAGAKGFADSKVNVRKPRLGGRQGPGRRFWLRVEDDGRELAFEREPYSRHLTVEVVVLRSGRADDQTKVWDVEVRSGLDKVIYRPRPRGEGWRRHDREDWTNVWRRPVSLGWQLLNPRETRALTHCGKVWWRRPVKGGAS